jgi:cytochrome c oxidase subunit 3
MNSPSAGELPPRFMGDLAELDTHGHGNRSLTWWGMMGMIAIEGTAFVLAIATYFYLANQSREWPPNHLLPDPLPGTLFTVLTVLSLVPNIWLQRMAEAERIEPVRIGLLVMSLVGIVLVIIRYFEFPALLVTWDQSAYGSIMVTLLGLHTVHVVTDLIDTLVLTALMMTSHGKGRRFVDVAENAIYWNFVVITWIPIYLVLYFAAKWL